MGGGSSKSDRRYDYTASSFYDESGGKAMVEKALAQAARENDLRRLSRAKLDVVAKPVYEDMQPFEHFQCVLMHWMNRLPHRFRKSIRRPIADIGRHISVRSPTFENQP